MFKKLKNYFKQKEWQLFNPIYLGLGTGVSIPDIDMVIMAFFFAKGFSATQVGIGLSLQSLFLLIAEIPTGVFADLYGKRKSVQVSWLMQSLIFGLFFFITEPWMMWFLFSLKGIAYTFSSGAFESLPYDIAKKAKREDLINKFYSTFEFVYQFATAFSNLNAIIFLYLVGATTQYFVFGQSHQGLDFLWLTGCVGYFVGAMILSGLKEKTRKVTFSLKKNFADTVKISKQAIKYTSSHPVVKKLLFVGIFSEVVNLFFSDVVYQSFLLDLKLDVRNLPIMVALGSLMGAVFSLVPKYFSKKFSSEKKYLEIMMVARLLVLTSLFVVSGPIAGLIFFVVYFSFSSLISPIMSPFKQYFYQKNMRASRGSLESLVRNIISIVLFPAIGFALDNFGSHKTALMAFFPLILVILIFHSIEQREALKH